MTSTTVDDGTGGLKAVWWIVLLLSAATALVGLYLVFNLYSSAKVLAWVVGLGLILSGIGDLLLDRYENKAIGIGLGVVSIGAGIVSFVWPEATLWVIAVVVGVSFVVHGLVRTGIALTHRNQGSNWGWVLADGLVSLAVGVAVLVWPKATVLVLGLLFGLRLLVVGLIGVAGALAVRSVAKDSGAI